MADKQTFHIPARGSREDVRKAIDRLELDKAYDITIEPHRKRRTSGQNRLMHAWIREVTNHVSQHTGYEFYEVKALLKEMFIEPSVIEIGEHRAEYRSTSALDTKEAAEFMDKIHRWASVELNLTLPLPPTAEQRG